MDKCSTCQDQPIWGCNIFGCDEVKGCFVICPECGKNGFTTRPEVFSSDMELAALLTAERNKWRLDTPA